MNRDWHKAVIGPETTIREAMQVIDQGSLKIALVLDESETLLGVVTDGDIRRGILRHIDLEDPVLSVTNNAPVICHPSDPMEKIRKLLEDRVLLHIPVVESGKIVDLITWEQAHAPKEYDNPVFLMAGGFGTRLRPLTEETPKPLLNVGNKPILETILERFAARGFSNFYISLHYLPEKVIDHFGDGSRWGVHIRYLQEDQPLGTAGALGLLPLEELPDKPLIMMNGDLLTQVDVEQLLIFHEQQHASATMCVRQYEFQVPYGVVDAQGSMVSRITEKPSQRFFVNAGIYVLNRELVGRVEPHTPLDMPNFLNRQIEADEPVAIFPIHEYWLDIGKKEDFDQAQLDYDTDFS